MPVFLLLVLIFTGDRILADVFQTSRTDTTIELTKVDGEMVSNLDSLLFDVKSCGKVQLSINMDKGRIVIDIYPNKTSHMKHCKSSIDTCTGEILIITGNVCNDYTPLWVKVSYYNVVIGEGCEVAEVGLWSYSSLWNFLMGTTESIEISSVDDAWWRLGKSSCQPVTTQATTTTLTTQPAATPATATETTPEATPEATSQTPRPLINETVPENMGRSAGAVRSSCFTGMIIALTQSEPELTYTNADVEEHTGMSKAQRKHLNRMKSSKTPSTGEKLVPVEEQVTVQVHNSFEPLEMEVSPSSQHKDMGSSSTRPRERSPVEPP
ncbi:uncharacterized protein [Haliotis asinina]|uniref:uncharacterized protein n=1 Tax=Haliotis asinina TaxID=109174 RepID=UPI003531A7C3